MEWQKTKMALQIKILIDEMYVRVVVSTRWTGPLLQKCGVVAKVINDAALSNRKNKIKCSNSIKKK